MTYIYVSQVALVVKNLPANAGDIRDAGLIPELKGLMPWRRAWQPTPVFLPGESTGQRSLVGYSPGGCIVLDTTERLCTHVCMTTVGFVSAIRTKCECFRLGLGFVCVWCGLRAVLDLANPR